MIKPKLLVRSGLVCFTWLCTTSASIAPITCLGLSSNEEALIAHVKDSITQAEQGKSKLTPEILSMEGCSSPWVRHFLNNLCSMPNVHYLEIGAWKGSTCISALYQNNLDNPVIIDNWSHCNPTGSLRGEFLQHYNRFLSNTPFCMIEEDCFALPLNRIPTRPNIYFYDGDHSYESQFKAFVHYSDVLDDLFVAIVDDYSWDVVRAGTQDAFQKLQYEILYEIFLPSYHEDLSGWWNGLGVAVIKKAKKD